MRLLCIFIGYLCGSFLTAQLVARYKTGKSADQLGSGNPGMANMAAQLGKKWAALTLIGDILKTVLPVILCRFLLFPSLGQIAILYVGLGVALGHGFPFWHRFRGGKSVTVTCTYIVLFAPLWGIVAALFGLGTVLLSGYLTLGALVIPCLFLIPVFAFYGTEAGAVALAGTVLLFFLHRNAIWKLVHQEEKRIDLWAKLIKR